MTAEMISIVLWTFVFAFVVCVGTGLSVILGWYEPTDPSVKTWLTRGLVFAIVGAVASTGGYIIKTGRSPFASSAAPDESPEKGTGLPPEKSGASKVAPPHKSTAENADITPGDDNADRGTLDQQSKKSADHPSEVRSWAETELGQRPAIEIAENSTPYPNCVVALGNKATSDVRPSETEACVRQLDRHHQGVILGFYNLKEKYDAALEIQESKLRKAGISDEEQPLYNYVLSEMDRLNNTDSQDFKALSQLEDRIKADRQRCAKTACR